MATYIPYQPALDPLGAAFGAGMGQGLAGAVQQYFEKKDLQNIGEWMKFNQTAQAAQNWLAKPDEYSAVPGMPTMEAPSLGLTPMPQMKSPFGRQLQQQITTAQMENFIPSEYKQAQIEHLRAQSDLYRAQTVAEGQPQLKTYEPKILEDGQGNTREWVPGRDPFPGPGWRLAAAAKASDVPWWANPKDENYDSQVARTMRDAEMEGKVGIESIRGRKALEIEKSIKQGTATKTDRDLYDRLMGGGPNIVFEQRLPKEYYDDLEKNILAIENVKRLKDHMAPGRGGANTVGVWNQIITWAENKLGRLPEDKAVFLSDKAMMYRLIKQTAQESRMSDQDLEWLAKILPDEWQRDETFISVLDSLYGQAQSQYNRQYEVITDPLMKAAVPKSYALYYSGNNKTGVRPQSDPLGLFGEPTGEMTPNGSTR